MKPNYINNNNNKGNIGHNLKSKNIVAPLFNKTNERLKEAISFENKPDSDDSKNKINIIFIRKLLETVYKQTKKECNKNVKFKEVAPSNKEKYIFNGKIIDKNKTLAELGIYNNSIIFEIDEDVQDLLIIDHYPQSNGNNSENEKQMIYFYLTLDQDNSTKYKMFIQSKKSRNLSEIFLYFNKKISKKIFNLISFFKFDILDKPTILNQIKSLDELGIQNYNNILILIKQNVWIIDENPLITKEDSKYKFISKEQ